MSMKVLITALCASAALSTPAFAQLGGTVSGTVGGTVDSTIDGSVTSRTRFGVDTPRPDVTVRTPSRVTVNAPASATVRSGTYSGSRYYGGHYHGAYFHDHGHYGYDHFHDHDDAHTHGYAKLVVKVDNTKSQPVGPLLTYGTQVYSRKDKDLGQVIGLTRSNTGIITHVMVSDVPGAIPVDTLRADGNILVTSMKRKHLK